MLRAPAILLAVLGAVIGGTAETENAAANGDTRSLSLVYEHTKESLTVTYKRDGRYDRAALDQLNWLLRDWRENESIKMDPRLFDTVWEAQRSLGSSEPIRVLCGYRSPKTNGMLRRRSRGVADQSQHMLGKAMDFFLTDASIDDIRAVGMRMQRGGVGWYPRSGSPFVHLDVGSVRAWPRMTHDQLARLFPDGKTVHLPTDNRPLARYEEARAEILARGGTVLGVTQYAGGEEEAEDGPSLKSFFAGLFGGSSSAPAPAAVPASAGRRKPAAVAVASADPEDGIGAQKALAYAAADPARRDARSLLTAEPAPQAAQTAPPPAPSAAQESEGVVAPLPPRRPAEFAAVAAALSMPMPLPPARPSQFAALGDAGLPVAAVLRRGEGQPLGMAALPPSPPAPVSLSPAAGPSSVAAATEAPVRKVALVPADADARTQLRALFEAVAVAEEAQAAGRSAPVRVALAKPLTGAAPGAVIAAPAGPVATRFAARGAGDELSASRFSGSSTRAVPGSR